MSLSQNNEVLIYLQQHGSITPMEALREIGCFRLGARIWDLKQQGHDIRRVMETRNGKTYARYSMDCDQLPVDLYLSLKAECGK